MHLMYYTGADGKRCYTLKKEDPSGKPTHSAHPARFSPDDKFSKERITTKKRFNLLPTQSPTRYNTTAQIIQVVQTVRICHFWVSFVDEMEHVHGSIAKRLSFLCQLV
ncbi:hypothetical protein Ae201684P_003128 [Aphanomyces euteiches]|nr:hypothetical protein Ae201684P_003128 [Aphanomyces euteiches]